MFQCLDLPHGGVCQLDLFWFFSLSKEPQSHTRSVSLRSTGRNGEQSGEKAVELGSQPGCLPPAAGLFCCILLLLVPSGLSRPLQGTSLFVGL